MSKRYWKGTDLTLSLAVIDDTESIVPLSLISSLDIYLRTTGEEYVKVSKGNGIVDDENGDLYIVLQQHSLDMLPDGLLRWEAHININDERYPDGYDFVKSCETDIFVKTPEKYEPKRFEEKYIEINHNGQYALVPEGGYEGISKAEITVTIPIQEKSINIQTNGQYTLIPDEGYEGISKANINVNVVKPLQDKTVTYTTNGQYEILPDEGYEGISKANINVNVVKPLQDKTVTYTTNGQYEILPDEGYEGINRANINVATTTRLRIADWGIYLGDSKFTEIPDFLDFDGITNFAYMFTYCDNLTTVRKIDTSSALIMDRMFNGCSNIESVEELDASSCNSMYLIFFQCRKLTYFGGFIGLKCDLDLSRYNTELSHDSLMNVINKAADVTASSATLTLGSTLLAKLSDEEKAVATNKGWTLA